MHPAARSAQQPCPKPRWRLWISTTGRCVAAFGAALTAQPVGPNEVLVTSLPMNQMIEHCLSLLADRQTVFIKLIARNSKTVPMAVALGSEVKRARQLKTGEELRQYILDTEQLKRANSIVPRIDLCAPLSALQLSLQDARRYEEAHVDRRALVDRDRPLKSRLARARASPSPEATASQRSAHTEQGAGADELVEAMSR